MVSLGLVDAGYTFLNTDDCWMAQRSPLAMTSTDNTSVEGVVAIYNGTIGVDSARFPSGIAALSSYIHARGLKMGLYTAQCSTTCQFRPGSYEHEALDASTFCEWGADYLKIDQCGGPCHAHLNTSWQLFREALDKCASSRNRSAITMACSRYVMGGEASSRQHTSNFGISTDFVCCFTQLWRS